MYKKSDPVTRLCTSDVDIWKTADEAVPYQAP